MRLSKYASAARIFLYFLYLLYYVVLGVSAQRNSG